MTSFVLVMGIMKCDSGASTAVELSELPRSIFFS
jgi:hypothetical protein